MARRVSPLARWLVQMSYCSDSCDAWELIIGKLPRPAYVMSHHSILPFLSIFFLAPIREQQKEIYLYKLFSVLFGRNGGKKDAPTEGTMTLLNDLRLSDHFHGYPNSISYKTIFDVFY